MAKCIMIVTALPRSGDGFFAVPCRSASADSEVLR